MDPATAKAIARCKRDARMLAVQDHPTVIDCAWQLAEAVPGLGVEGALEVIDAIGKWLLKEESKK
jgi:hypothetical protein